MHMRRMERLTPGPRRRWPSRRRRKTTRPPRTAAVAPPPPPSPPPHSPREGKPSDQTLAPPTGGPKTNKYAAAAPLGAAAAGSPGLLRAGPAAPPLRFRRNPQHLLPWSPASSNQPTEGPTTTRGRWSQRQSVGTAWPRALRHQRHAPTGG